MVYSDCLLPSAAVLESLRPKSADGTSRLAEALTRQRVRALYVAVHIALGALSNRLLRRLKLHDDPGESLGERVMHVARHAITLFEYRSPSLRFTNA